MDRRQALAPGTTLTLESKNGSVHYTVRQEIGRGGSCIVYDASYEDNLGNRKLVRIKECCPNALHIERGQDGALSPAEEDLPAFQAAISRFREAYQKNHELFEVRDLTNSVANTSDIYLSGGTCYIVSTYLQACTFREYQGETLHDCLSLVLSAARALDRIHGAGYLYLDLKPENILTIRGSHDLVQLFDFDSMVSRENLLRAIRENDPGSIRTSYTRGFAPFEQRTGRLRELGKHTDIYALGAVLFFGLFRRVPTAFDGEQDAVYDFEGMAYPCRSFPDRLFRALTAFFHRTLASFPGDRYQDAGEAAQQLKQMLPLADALRPFVRSTPLSAPQAFYGREQELQALRQCLENSRHGIASLSGMGGIGKSTLVRRYLCTFHGDWDACVTVYDQGSLMDVLADDSQLQLNTVSREKDESTQAYVQRKLEALGLLAHDQEILLVIDNFIPEHLEQLDLLARTGATILLISRERLPEGFCPCLQLGEMTESALAALFSHYAHCDLQDDQNLQSFRTIVDSIAGHTLLTELIARQIAKSFLDLQVAEAMMAGLGLGELPKEKIDYVRDRSAYHGTLLKILDRLVEADRFSEDDRRCLKLLSLFDMPGIEAGLFRRLSALPSLDFVNDLESAGWLKAEKGQLYLHPLMQEYVRTWTWDEDLILAADQMMRSLYRLILPTGVPDDAGKQFPKDYLGLLRLLRVADQMLRNITWVSESSQRLLFRTLMDAPVDEDTTTLFRMLDLLEDPRHLDPDTVLRLYENAAYFRARLYSPEDALQILEDMRHYLTLHPSDYYLSACHRAMAVILHNRDVVGSVDVCLLHEDQAIAAARRSHHPEAGRQLAACLLEKVTTLLSVERDRPEARRLIREAAPLIGRFCGPYDPETYQYHCAEAICAAQAGERDTAKKHLAEADGIAYASPDSDLSIAEHLLEFSTWVNIYMQDFEAAADAVMEAIQLCEKHLDALRYRETRFDAWTFLGEVYARAEWYVKAEEAFQEAEKYVQDWPYEVKLPLCPEEIREKAEAERNGQV
ncbi:MAG: AAA family ATPase [Clostridia bacterium]|nr:AAA family ATPase [Clostridia bacterium]